MTFERIRNCVYERVRQALHRGNCRVGALAVIIVMSGCAAQQVVDAYVTDVSPMPSTLLEQRVALKLRLQNLSQTPLSADGIDVQLIVNGKQLARGVDAKKIDIKPLSDTLTSVTVSLRAIGVLRQILDLRTREVFTYRLKGRLITPGFDKRFEHGGEMTRAELLAMFPQQQR